jgi:autotransporter-associated beta strand protein
MKFRKSILIASLALAAPPILHANPFFFSGTDFGAWNPDNSNNWNGNPPGFGNTADVIFDGNILDTYGTWLGNGDRTIRSITFSNIAQQLEIRTNNNATTARQLRYAADSGNATITVNSTVTAPIIIGAVGGLDGSNNGTQRLDSNLDIIHNGSALLTMRRPINESGGSWGITTSGSGTVLFNGSLNYTGVTTISGGTLEINTGTPMTGNIVNNASFVSSGATNRSLAGDISGTGSLTIRGGHALTLTGTNNFAGGIILEAGDLNAGAANIGSGIVTFAGNGNVARWFIPDGSVIANDILFADGSTNNKVIGVATPTSHAELTGTITFAADSTTTGTSRIAPVGSTIVISGIMTGDGTGGYAKRNNGTVVITGTDNDYTGPTTIVDAGTLLVDGSIQSDVFFGENLDGSSTSATNGTLGGSGLINANVTTQSESNLSPGGTSNAGVNTHTAATLSIGGNLDISRSAAGLGLITMQLGIDSDLIDLTGGSGALTIGNGVLGFGDFNFIAEAGFGDGGIGSFHTLIASNNPIIGTLDTTDLTGVISGFDVQLGFSDTGNDLILTVIPEPSAALYGLLLGLGLLRRRRR